MSLVRARAPENLFIIATMNTSDRSISSIDFALRRRFSFIEMYPNPNLLNGTVGGFQLADLLVNLNKIIIDKIGRENQIGHSYFMELNDNIDPEDQFSQIFLNDVIPLLEDYCFRKYDLLAELLGNEIVDLPNLQIQEKMKETDHLLQAIQQRFELMNVED